MKIIRGGRIIRLEGVLGTRFIVINGIVRDIRQKV